MKATGIVRRIDDLGRVVIPKEIRRTMRIHEGDPLEIYTDNGGEVIFKKYSPLGELSTFAGQYAEVLAKTSGHPVIVCDRDHVIHVSGLPRRELVERRVTDELESAMNNRTAFSYGTGESGKMKPVQGSSLNAICGAPIISDGDVCGAIILLSADESTGAGEVEIKLIATAAAFLGKQMEV